MFGTAFSQLRYTSAILRNRPIRPRDLERIARDLVATLAEFGEPGEDSALLPGQAGQADPEIRRTVAVRGLRATARAAARHTAYYQRLFAEHGLDPETLTPETWESVPVTEKSALRALPAAFVSAAARPALMALTTGTSGTPTAVWYSRAETEVVVALSTVSAVLGVGLRPHHTMAYGGCSRATLPLLSTEESVTRVGAAFVQIGTVDPALALDRLAAPLNLPGKAPQITHLNVSASYLAALVQTAERDGWRATDFGLEHLAVGGEVLSAPLRERAEAAFGARISAGYMMTETLPSGGTPCTAGHLHHSTEFGSGPLSRSVTTRDLLDLIEAEPEVPLPARYALVDAPRGPELHLRVAALPAHALLGRLEDRASAARLPLESIVLHDDPDDMPPTGPVRADLREHTFEAIRPAAVRVASPA
ncbi:phenylacetate--CoA ligase family protein [Streptomyces sp. NEAU-H3]|uniref:phenylacetate--CoA ligase family protein n=1 Tax=Streptomyces sp. NEAU-H3 TaxID=2720636 RepID=UPI001438D172|nr:phenylacetate--CoA ligase family protein [Streptomyces sp. NEAU-H3]NJA58625.1 phenylacetate--CoA ligase family protein [Streptomyces sp. NEAU-H3]